MEGCHVVQKKVAGGANKRRGKQVASVGSDGGVGRDGTVKKMTSNSSGPQTSVHLLNSRISLKARRASGSDLHGFFNFLITTLAPDTESIAMAVTERPPPWKVTKPEPKKKR